MGRTLEYCMAMEHYKISGEVFDVKAGRVISHPIKLVSAKGLEENVYFGYESNLKDDYERIMSCEVTRWVLASVRIGSGNIMLHYERPDRDYNTDDHINIFAEKDVELKFEVERGRKLPPDIFLVDCADKWGHSQLQQSQYFPQYHPRITEILNGGQERCTFTFKEHVEHKDWYNVEETKF